jgi:tetratricopeptide (TPR) repeat protein
MLAALLLASAGEPDRTSEAHGLFEEVVSLDPNRVDAHIGLGRLANQIGKTDQAVQSYRRALALEPYHRQALNDLAWILSAEQGKLAEALELADKGVAAYPTDVHLLDTRGVILLKLERLAEARMDLERCLRYAEDLPDTRARALLHSAQVYEKLGESELQRIALEEAVSIDKRHKVFTPLEQALIKRMGNLPAP